MPGLFQPAEPISPSVRAQPPAVGCPAYSPTERPKGKYLVPLLLIKVQSRLLEPSILLPEATSTPNQRTDPCTWLLVPISVPLSTLPAWFGPGSDRADRIPYCPQIRLDPSGLALPYLTSPCLALLCLAVESYRTVLSSVLAELHLPQGTWKTHCIHTKLENRVWTWHAEHNPQ
ncbi:hypothetical protein CCUS01_12693 [Colletotrichum cuscutae]|uniref:Uncharacterized protein n=1 Tax=Colletotrichum cuscutae TaxID=1209917 RepID=A0AAI9TTU5_9PEZI|nr:hypothetical protein CCUS01_12693 [Colletotrichum cuscutae]